jgi:hypothetical protein
MLRCLFAGCPVLILIFILILILILFLLFILLLLFLYFDEEQVSGTIFLKEQKLPRMRRAGALRFQEQLRRHMVDDRAVTLQEVISEQAVPWPMPLLFSIRILLSQIANDRLFPA